MIVIYDNQTHMYRVVIEPSEMSTWINTDDIVEARKEFVDRMTWMFNQAICERLKNEF